MTTTFADAGGTQEPQSATTESTATSASVTDTHHDDAATSASSVETSANTDAAQAENTDAASDSGHDFREDAPVGAQVNGQTVQRDGSLADPTRETGAGGVALPAGVSEVGGGGEIKSLPHTNDTADTRNLDQELQLRAARSSAFRPLLAASGRPTSEIGLVGLGQTFRGHAILIDVDTLEKVRVFPDQKLPDDRVFANVRNFPEALTQGDLAANLKG